MSPLKNMAAPSPAKAHDHEMHEKAGACEYRCGAIYPQSQNGDEPPPCAAFIIRMYITMTAANCSPAEQAAVPS